MTGLLFLVTLSFLVNLCLFDISRGPGLVRPEADVSGGRCTLDPLVPALGCVHFVTARASDGLPGRGASSCVRRGARRLLLRRPVPRDSPTGGRTDP